MENLDACELTHGGNQSAVDGMWLTFINSVKQMELEQYLSNSTKVKKVLPCLVNKRRKVLPMTKQPVKMEMVEIRPWNNKPNCCHV